MKAHEGTELTSLGGPGEELTAPGGPSEELTELTALGRPSEELTEVTGPQVGGEILVKYLTETGFGGMLGTLGFVGEL